MKHASTKLLIPLLIVVIISTFITVVHPTGAASAAVPNFSHVFTIVLENEEYQNVIGSKSAPYFNSLANQYGLATQYYAVSHPSLPNYLALTGGDTFGITSDCTTCFINAPNIVDRLESAGKSWKAYMEDMPSPCFVGSSGNYQQKHNPFIYYDDIRTNSTRCNKIVPFTNFSTDLKANALPNYVWITPNMCNDGHDCGVAASDSWLKTWVPQILASNVWQQGGVLFITYDEGSTSNGFGNMHGGHVATVVISALGKPSYQSATQYSHYSLLHTVETAWGLPPLKNDANATVMSDFFTNGTPSTASPTSTPKASPTNSPVPTSMPKATPTQLPTPTASPQPGSDPQPSLPLRAVFYYPWFPEAWSQNGIQPYTNYHPSLGYYDSSDPAVIRQHIAAMQYGHISAGIASWWGQGSATDKRIPTLLSVTASNPFRWSVYYEPEGYGNPSVQQITSDLTYLRDHYGRDPSYLRINGRFVVFVYADGSDNCAMADRWKQANTVGAYIVLKVFSGYQSCTSQPDGWHQYGPASAADSQGKYSYTISPGFWKVNESPRLTRDITRWQQNVRNMVASKAQFQLVTTFNEWGEGTAVESATEWASASGYGAYLDALHTDGN